jgi:uncharacterized repeat protein (TIGR03803 family)
MEQNERDGLPPDESDSKEGIMHTTKKNPGAKPCLKTSDGKLRVGSTKVTAVLIRGVLIFAVFFFPLIVARPARAQFFEKMVYSFYGNDDGTGDAQFPSAGLTLHDGNFYGTTWDGGYNAGTVYEISSSGESVLYSFGGYDGDGEDPYSVVVFDSSGNLYGTTNFGGTNNQGIVFELSPAGETWTETVLYNFCSLAGCADGGGPLCGVVIDTAGNLYGTNSAGVFELSRSGGAWTEQIIYPQGAYSTLSIDATGNLYGATASTIFQLSPNGSGGWNSSVVHTFPSSAKDGVSPTGPPTFDSTGNGYGITASGGANGTGTIYKLTPGKYKLDKGTWKESVIYSYRKNTIGYGLGCMFYPSYACGQGLAIDGAGNLYLNPYAGGFGKPSFLIGSVLELAAPIVKGKGYREKNLWSFNGTDGAGPVGTPVLDSAGNVYGVTSYGGPGFEWDYCAFNENCGYGVVFEIYGVN